MKNRKIKNAYASLKNPIGLLRYYLSDIVYGATDGVVTTFTIISGVEGAQLTTQTAVILGLVNIFADGLSMGASRFLSIRAETATQALSSGYKKPLSHASATFLAFVALGGVPLISFLIPGFSKHRFLISCVMTSMALILIGTLRSLSTKERWLRSVLEMLVIGGFTAILAYFSGHVLGQWLN